MTDVVGCAMSLLRGDVLVEVDATVGELAERSLALELCGVLSAHAHLQSHFPLPATLR